MIQLLLFLGLSFTILDATQKPVIERSELKRRAAALEDDRPSQRERLAQEEQESKEFSDVPMLLSEEEREALEKDLAQGRDKNFLRAVKSGNLNAVKRIFNNPLERPNIDLVPESALSGSLIYTESAPPFALFLGKLTPLMVALFFGHEALAQFLIEQGADINKVVSFGSKSFATPLSLTLIKKGDKVNYFKKPGEALPKIAKLLIKQGADLDSISDSALLFKVAMHNNDLNLFKFLVRSGLERSTYITELIRSQDPQDMRFLGNLLANNSIKPHRRLKIESVSGYTGNIRILDWAIIQHNPEAVRLLLSYGANPYREISLKFQNQNLNLPSSIVLSEQVTAEDHKELKLDQSNPLDELRTKQLEQEYNADLHVKKILDDYDETHRQRLASSAQKILESGLKHPKNVQTAEQMSAAQRHARQMGGQAQQLSTAVQEFLRPKVRLQDIQKKEAAEAEDVS